MNLNNVSMEDLQAEVRRRNGIKCLEQQVDYILRLQNKFELVLKAKEALFVEINRLKQGGNFEGKYPLVEEYESAITEFKEFVIF